MIYFIQHTTIHIFIKTLKGKKFVLTVHDMTQELFPNLLPTNDKTSEQKKYLVKKSDKNNHSIRKYKKRPCKTFGMSMRIKLMLCIMETQ